MGVEVIEGYGVCCVDDAGEYVVGVVECEFADELFAEQMVFYFAVHSKFINSVKIGSLPYFILDLMSVRVANKGIDNINL